MIKFSSIAFTSALSIVLCSGAWANHNSAESLQARIAAVGTINIGEGSSEAGSDSSEPADGESVYNTTCGVCHGTGVAGAPVLGKADDWTDRISAGMEMMVEHAIQGYTGSAGVMPAKGGNPSLSDNAVTVAVQYMVDQVK